MKLSMLGTGSILTNSLSACTLIDDCILVDVPNGSVKSLRRFGVEPIDINLCLITHFHGDHYFDMPFLLLEHGLSKKDVGDFIIIGPEGTTKKIKELFMMAFPEDWENIKASSRMKIVEFTHNTSILRFKEYSIKPIQVSHGVCDAYGYVIDNGEIKIGFTGDSCYCSGVENIFSTSDYIVADMSFAYGNSSHMGVNDIEHLINKYDKLGKVYPTHMTENAKKCFSEKFYEAPKDGDTYII